MRIFISHISEEAKLAQCLREWIVSTFLGRFELFVSSDPGAIPLGNRWMEDLSEALGQAELVITVVSRHSISRPWINFETGAAWMRQLPILPICHSGLALSSLPQPYASFQGLEVESKQFPARLLESLAARIGIARIPKIDQAQFQRDLATAIAGSSVPVPVAAAPSEAENRLVSSLSDFEIKALRELSRATDLNQTPVQEQRLAQSVGCRISELKLAIDNLVDLGFVRNSLRVGGPISYAIRTEGLRVLRAIDGGEPNAQ